MECTRASDFGSRAKAGKRTQRMNKRPTRAAEKEERTNRERVGEQQKPETQNKRDKQQSRPEEQEIQWRNHAHQPKL